MNKEHKENGQNDCPPKARYAIDDLKKAVRLDGVPGGDSMGAWFLGPRGESRELLRDLIVDALNETVDTRQIAYINDPEWADTSTDGYRREARHISIVQKRLLRRLGDYSIPWYSYGYQAHMNWDNTLPAVAGYFAGLLYNQNNVAAEGGPVTVAMEIEVARDICRMLGYGNETSWGHITCGGTVANIEAIWAMRNIKLYPFAVRYALLNEAELKKFNGLKVTQPSGNDDNLVDLSWWELFNLKVSDILDLPESLAKLGASEKEIELINKHTVQALGLNEFAKKHDEQFGAQGDIIDALRQMRVFVSGLRHYSIPKGTTLCGLGTVNLKEVPVTRRGQIDCDELIDMIEEAFNNRIPVMGVITILGTTQEGAVDDLEYVVGMRENFNKSNRDYAIHVDAAWGGYFASALHNPPPSAKSHAFLSSAKQNIDKSVVPSSAHWGANLAVEQFNIAVEDIDNDLPANERMAYTAEMSLSNYVTRQLRAMPKADSITVDPHKAGFIPYPAGALCYKDHRMPEMIQIKAPIVFHGGKAPTVGIFGIEGSKPGAASCAVWFSHRIIRPDQSGYGKLLGRCSWNAKRLFIEISTMRSKFFRVAVLQTIGYSDEQEDWMNIWKNMSNRELWKDLASDADKAEFFMDMGSDLNIINYAFNPYMDKANNQDNCATSNINKDQKIANELNEAVFRTLSLEYEGDEWPPVVVTGSKYEIGKSCDEVIDSLRTQLCIENNLHEPMQFLVSTMMNPWASDADGGKRNMIFEKGDTLKLVVEKEVAKLRKRYTQQP